VWIADVLAGKFDDDGGGRRPHNRQRQRKRVRGAARLADDIRGQGWDVLTYEDYQLIEEIALDLAALGKRGSRIREQQSNSGDKRGKVR